MQNPQETNQYGTLRWFEQAYSQVPTDPWGLSWRPSQQLRYNKVLSLLDAIEEPLGYVMDVGCATGDFTYLLSKHLRGLQSLLGIDFVDSAVERARHRFPNLIFSTESVFVIGDKYPEQFDLIVCPEMIYYIPRLQQTEALKSVKAALRPGGYAIFSSMISPPPYFLTPQLLKLVGSEFEIIRYEVLYLRLVSLIEKIGERLTRFLPHRDGGKLRFGRLPYPAVVAVEQWSRCLKSFTASHTIVLARVPL